MKRVVGATLTALLLACSPAADDGDADTMSLASVDTLKPATDSAALGASTGASSGASAAPASGIKQSTTAAATQSKTGTKIAPADSTNIGRDRALPINTKDPKVRLPTVDTTKRPPQK